MAYFSEDREILRDLFKSKGGCDLYSFHTKYHLSPAQLSRSLGKFLANGVIERDGERIFLSDYGRKWVLANRHSIFFFARNMNWKRTLAYLTWKTSDENQPYQLKIGKLQMDFFEK